MNQSEKLYLGVNGKYYQRHELASAFFLSTGQDLYDIKNENVDKLFELWVHDLLGLSIKKIVDASKITYEEFLVAGQKLLAVREYRNRNNSTLREAKEHVDEIEYKLKKEGIIA